MDENNILDTEQSDEIAENGDVLGEPDTENNIQIVEEEASPYALNDFDYGTISTTYLEYFQGIVQKLPYDVHYVIWKSGDNNYSLAYGEDIVLNGEQFSGDCEVVEVYRSSTTSNYDWYVETSSDTLSLNADKLFLYSDLGMFPTVERGFNDLEANAVLFAICFCIVFSICHDIFDYVLERLRR